MESRVLVSVSVVTYNHKDYIKQCLDGILMQHTNFPFEVILGEDESDDGTREICKTYAAQHPDKIRLFFRSRKDVIYINGRPTGRFNMIENLKACKGKYIALCEGDDYWTDPLKLQKQFDFMSNNDDFVACFHPCFKELMVPKNNKIIKQELSSIKYNYSIKNLLSIWNIPTASLFFKNELNFPDWFTVVASGDIALLMLVFEKGKLKLLEDYMSVYRNTGLGVSKTHVNYRMIHYRAVLYSHLNEYFNYRYEKEIYQALFHIYSIHSDLSIFEKKESNIINRVLTKINSWL